MDLRLYQDDRGFHLEPVKKPAPVAATLQESEVRHALSPEKIAQEQQRRKIDQLLTGEKPDGFLTLTTPFYAAVVANEIEDQVKKDWRQVIYELQQCGIDAYCENTQRCDPCKLAIHRAVPKIVGIITGYVLYRYAEVWIAFQNTEDYTEASVEVLQEQALVFTTPAKLKIWADSIHAWEAAQKRSEIEEAYAVLPTLS